VKANVLFFDRKPATEKAWTEKLWIYDLRTNKHFTLKENPLKRSDLDDFVSCYNPNNRHERKESERFKSFSYDELTKRHKLNLDMLTPSLPLSRSLDLPVCLARFPAARLWLKDESLEDSANLPMLIAAEIETRSLPTLTYCYPRSFTLIARTARCLRQLTLAALPSTRAMPDRDVFYVAFPISSIRPLGLPICVARVPAAPFARSRSLDRYLIAVPRLRDRFSQKLRSLSVKEWRPKLISCVMFRTNSSRPESVTCSPVRWR